MKPSFSRRIQVKLVGSINLIRLALGTLDRNVLNWMAPIIKKYEGVHGAEAIKKGIDVMAKLTDAQLDSLVTREAASRPHLSLKKCSLPYLEAKMDLIGFFPENVQRILLAINAHLEFRNQEVESSVFYMRKSFDSPLGDRETLENNLRGSYNAASEGAEIIVNLINKLDEILGCGCCQSEKQEETSA